MTVKQFMDKVKFELGNENKLPPQFYISVIEESIKYIYQWLLANDILFDITNETISTISGTESYTITQGYTVRVSNGLTEIIPTFFQKKYEYSTQGTPIYYFETLKKILFIPIPNAVFSIKREYIPYPTLTYTNPAEVLPFDSPFNKLLILAGCIQTINLADKETLEGKSALLPKWTEERKLEEESLKTIYRSKEVKVKQFYKGLIQ